MKFIKKVSAASWIVVATFVLTLVGLIGYLANTKTTYFVTMGVNSGVVLFAILAIVAEAAYVALDFFRDNKILSIVGDVVGILIPVLIIASFTHLLDARIYYSATILTYEKTDQNVADLIPALVSMVSMFVGVLSGIVAAFFARKENKANA